MSVTAEELLDWAFHANDQDETDKRAIISRAYYAAYHRCSEWHSGLRPYFGFHRPNVGLHEKLVDQLRHPHLMLPPARIVLSKELGDRLANLKDLRTLADYRLRSSLRLNLHGQACTEADEILRLAV
jgi:hypothetical protein